MGPLDLVDTILFVEDTPAGRRKWRLTMALTMIVLIGHTIWACGLLPGLEGFAQAGDVKQAQQAVTRIEAKLLDKDIIDTIRQKCTATDKRFLASRLRELKEQWRIITGIPYIEPGCDDL